MRIDGLMGRWEVRDGKYHHITKYVPQNMLVTQSAVPISAAGAC